MLEGIHKKRGAPCEPPLPASLGSTNASVLERNTGLVVIDTAKPLDAGPAGDSRQEDHWVTETRGNLIVNAVMVVDEAAEMLPPCAKTMDLAIARPRPVPSRR